MLELSNLKLEQLRQVYEWDNAPEIESFESYSNRLSRADWAHYSINDGADFIGCVSLELLNATTCSLHLSMRLRAASLRELQRLLLDLAGILFAGAMRTIICEIHPTNRPARLLAVSCGMTPAGSDDRCLYFTLTAKDYESCKACKDAVREQYLTEHGTEHNQYVWLPVV